VDAPAFEYGTALVDMEAAGFCAAASRLTVLELMQVFKVVSDTPEHPARDLNAAKVTRLIESSLAEIAAVDGELSRLSAELESLRVAPPRYAELLRRRHFSVTQQFQLEKLLRRWALLCPDSDPLQHADDSRGTATDLLNRLQLVLDRVPFQL
jgi:hypothetical protein